MADPDDEDTTQYERQVIGCTVVVLLLWVSLVITIFRISP